MVSTSSAWSSELWLRTTDFSRFFPVLKTSPCVLNCFIESCASRISEVATIVQIKPQYSWYRYACVSFFSAFAIGNATTWIYCWAWQQCRAVTPVKEPQMEIVRPAKSNHGAVHPHHSKQRTLEGCRIGQIPSLRWAENWKRCNLGTCCLLCVKRHIGPGFNIVATNCTWVYWCCTHAAWSV